MTEAQVSDGKSGNTNLVISIQAKHLLNSVEFLPDSGIQYHDLFSSKSLFS